VTAEQAAEQAVEVSSTAARLAACAATRRTPRLINRRLTARLRLARHLTFVVPLCRAATHPDKQALHRQPPEGQSRRTASCTKFLPRLRNGARGNNCINGQQIWTYQFYRWQHSCPFSRLRAYAQARNFPDYSVARLLCGWPWLVIVCTILLFTEHCHVVLLSFACMMQLFQCIIR